jgi:hypothetical protein
MPMSEFLPGHDVRLDIAAGPVSKHDVVADLGLGRVTELQRRQVEGAQRLHKAESGFLVVGKRVARNHAPVMACQPDLLGLGDQVADSQHQPVFADDDAAALPEIAERARSKGILWDGRAQGHD